MCNLFFSSVKPLYFNEQNRLYGTYTDIHQLLYFLIDSSRGICSADAKKSPSTAICRLSFTAAKKWQIQQLPANSVTYKFNTGSVLNPLYDFNLRKQEPVSTIVLPTTNKLLMNKYQTVPSPSLHLYLMQDRQQMIRDQKQGWWKDPAQAPGADFFRTIFMTNKNNWLYNSTSHLKD